MLDLLRWCRRTLRRRYRSVRHGFQAVQSRRNALAKIARRPQPHDAHVAAVRAGIDRTRWYALRDEWAARETREFNHLYIKYFDLDRWLPGAVIVARNAGLIRTAPKRMLDLGCGGGLLGRVAKHFGHDYVGTDVGNPMFMAMCASLDVRALASPVRRREPLPAELVDYDLITSINPMFYRREIIEGRSEQFWWDDDDWAFFLRDLRSRLRPGGFYYSKFNAEEQLPPGLWELLNRCRRFDQKSFLIRYDQLPK